MSGARHGQMPKTGSVPGISCPLSRGGQGLLKTRHPGPESGADGAWAVSEEDWQKGDFEYKRRRILLSTQEVAVPGPDNAKQGRARLYGICMWSESTRKVGGWGRRDRVN